MQGFDSLAWSVVGLQVQSSDSHIAFCMAAEGCWTLYSTLTVPHMHRL